MTIQMKSTGVILLAGGSVAVDPNCCCINLGECKCRGANAITVNVVDNFGYSVNTSGNYASIFVPTPSGCAFEAESPDYSLGTGYPTGLAWKVRAPFLATGFNWVALDWWSYDSGFFAPGLIRVNYAGGLGPWRFTRAAGLYIDVSLIC